MTQNISRSKAKWRCRLGAHPASARHFSLGLAGGRADVVPSSRREAKFRRRPPKCARSGAFARGHLRRHQRASVDALRDVVLGELGKVDILINCAGRISAFPRSKPQRAWNGILDTNGHGRAPRLAKAFGPGMLSRGYGRIVTSPRSQLRLVSRGHGLRAQQGRRRRAHPLTRRRMERARRHRQRHRAGRLPHRLQPKAARRHRARSASS